MSRAEQPMPRRAPVVTVSGGRAPAPAAPEPAPAASSRGTAVVVAALALAAVAVVLLQPPPPPPVEASLRVLPDRIATSQAGVVVVPVETDNRGPGVVVEELVVRADPVRQPSTASGVRRIGQGGRGGFAVLVQPDCGPLAPPSGGAFAASLTVALRTAAGARRDVLLDLDADPAVAARVAALCGGVPAA